MSTLSDNLIKFMEENGITSYSAFQRQLKKEVLDEVIKPLCSSRGMISEENLDAIKAHFPRGQKWVSFQSGSDFYNTAVEVASQNNYQMLIELWEQRGFCWVRYHSSTATKVNFSVHMNSSVGSNKKFSVSHEDALALNPIVGTPKSNGWEVRVSPKAQTEETEEPQSDAVVEETLDPVIVPNEFSSDVSEDEIPDSVPMTGLNELFETDVSKYENQAAEMQDFDDLGDIDDPDFDELVNEIENL